MSAVRYDPETDGFPKMGNLLVGRPDRAFRGKRRGAVGCGW